MESKLRTIWVRIGPRWIEQWKPEGSPIKGFTLEAEDIFGAEDNLVTIIGRGQL